jgi:hypothetical protein
MQEANIKLLAAGAAQCWILTLQVITFDGLLLIHACYMFILMLGGAFGDPQNGHSNIQI